jgi:hypothetical protein
MIGTEVLGSGLLLKFWLTRSHLKTLLDMLEKGKPSRRKIDTNYFQYNGYFLGYNSSKDNAGKYGAVAGAECNTVIELKPEHHAALPWHFA